MQNGDVIGAMPCEWVAGKYVGERAKSILAHANAGIGYTVFDQGKGWVLVAFRRAMDSPLPDHLVRITDPFKIDKLEKQRKERSGLHS